MFMFGPKPLRPTPLPPFESTRMSVDTTSPFQNQDVRLKLHNRDIFRKARPSNRNMAGSHQECWGSASRLVNFTDLAAMPVGPTNTVGHFPRLASMQPTATAELVSVSQRYVGRPISGTGSVCTTQVSRLPPFVAGESSPIFWVRFTLRHRHQDQHYHKIQHRDRSLGMGWAGMGCAVLHFSKELERGCHVDAMHRLMMSATRSVYSLVVSQYGSDCDRLSVQP